MVLCRADTGPGYESRSSSIEALSCLAAATRGGGRFRVDSGCLAPQLGIDVLDRLADLDESDVHGVELDDVGWRPLRVRPTTYACCEAVAAESNVARTHVPICSSVSAAAGNMWFMNPWIWPG